MSLNYLVTYRVKLASFFSTSSSPDHTHMASIAAEVPSLNELRGRFDDLAGKLSDEGVTEQVCHVIRDAMSLEASNNRSELANLLEHISAAIHGGHDDLRGLVLNNMGCVQKRMGEMKAALQTLRSAADAEGGITAASPVTLLNIASVYSGLQMYAEAAAVSNHAAHRCETSVQPVPVMLHAAALHNLGAALEGSGEIEHALQAYRSSQRLTAHAGVSSDHPQLKATQNALAQLELKLRNQRARSKRAEWSAQVERTVIQKSLRKLNDPSDPNNGKVRKELSSSAPPTMGSVAASRRLVPLPASLRNRSTTALQEEEEVTKASEQEATLVNSIHLSPIVRRNDPHDEDEQEIADISAARQAPARGTPEPYPHNKSRDSNSKLGGRSVAYTTSVKKFHVFREKGNGKMEKYKKIEQPAWDTNPFFHEPSRQVSDNSDVAVERSVSQSFVPHQIVPLLADLRYKETTRRSTIKQDFAKVMLSIQVTHEVERVFISEDEARIEEEIQELRERRVLMRWMAAKEVFVRGAVMLDAVEKEARTQLMTEHVEVLKQTVRPMAHRLHLQANEEIARVALQLQEEDARNDTLTEEETSKAAARVEEEITFSKRGLAHGLVMWCFEGVMPPEEAALLADPAFANSHFVLQRHNWFGKPYGHGGKADADVEKKAYLSTPNGSSSL